MGLFSFLRPKPDNLPSDLSFIGTDMHNHILPGLDDGSQKLETSVRYIKELHALGYKKFICTPHIISDVHPNTPETILPAFELLKKRILEENIPVELAFAAEYMVNTEFDDILDEGNILCFGTEKYVLIEMSYLVQSLNIKEAIFELIVKGYKPVLAHPERYNYYHRQNDKIAEFVELGCLLQINLLSLTGYYGRAAQETADWLVRNKMISFAGTDLHHDRHLGLMQKLAVDKTIIKSLAGLSLKNSSL